MTFNDPIPDDVFWDSHMMSRQQSDRIAAFVADSESFECPSCTRVLWDRERGLCTCSDRACLVCHRDHHQPGMAHRCAWCGDELFTEGGLCVRHAKERFGA